MQMTNVLTCLKHLDKTYSGIADGYEKLCEFAHPNWAGTVGMFSDGKVTSGKVSFGRYLHGTDDELKAELLYTARIALAAFVNDYLSVLDNWSVFVEACDREL